MAEATGIDVTDPRDRLLDVISRVETDGEEVAVFRHGRQVARIVPVALPVAGPPAALLGVDEGRVFVADSDDDLLGADATWQQA